MVDSFRLEDHVGVMTKPERPAQQERQDSMRPWRILFGWTVLAALAIGLAAIDAAQRQSCGGWGWGCDPAVMAGLVAFLTVPPLVVAAVATVVTRFVAPKASAWVAALGPLLGLFLLLMTLD